MGVPELSEIERLAKDVVAESVNPEDIDSVYVAGSLFVGLGNASSDVDVFIVVHDWADCDLRTVQVPKAGLRFDLEFQRVSHIYELADMVTNWKTDQSDCTPLRVGQMGLDEALRLYYGKEIISSPHLAKCHETLSGGAASVRRFVISWW